MSDNRLTRQGVRALDPIGHNGRRNVKTSCAHNFNGQTEVIGTSWMIDPFDTEPREEPIYGHRCLLGCGETRRA
jgi:hypothetical protein